MIKRIAHVCLNVKDLKRSIIYYKKLGLSVKFNFTKNGSLFGTYLQIADGHYIEMFENKNLGAIVNNGLAHFCLESDSIDLLVKHLQKEGIQYTAKKCGCDNTWQIWLTDPDGNSFEVHQYTEKSSQFTGVDVEADW